MKKCSLILLLVTSFVWSQVTSGEFLSNDLFDIGGMGTTLIFTSPTGVSWCSDIDQPEEGQVWHNITDIAPLFDSGDEGGADKLRSNIMAFDTYARLRLAPQRDNELRFFMFPYDPDAMIYNTVTHEITVDGSIDEYDFDSYGGVAGDKNSWIAVYDAGIVEVADTGIVAFHLPDSSAPVPVASYELESRLDSLSRPLGVDFMDSLLVAFAGNRIWECSLSTYQWSSFDIADTFTVLSLQFSWDQDTLFALVQDTNYTTAILQIDRQSKSVFSIIERAGISSFSVADRGSVYILYGDNGALTVRNGVTGAEVPTNLEYRKNQTNISPSHASRKVYVGGSGSETFLATSTNRGGLFSWDEYASDDDEEPLMYIYKSNPIETGLKQVMAVPSILHTGAEYMTFEYSLSEDARVTIDIFNANFEFLCRIVEDEPRVAGANTSDGRSTIRSIDRWDGSVNNRGGKTAPAGVYFFRITTDSGFQKFGRCIIAKN